MDLNERIARLLEQEPSIDECEENRHSDCFGWIGTRHDGWVPATFKESIDASMAVIEKRWPWARVILMRDRARIENLIDTGEWHGIPNKVRLGEGESETSAHALALALLAALEAEVKP